MPYPDPMFSLKKNGQVFYFGLDDWHMANATSKGYKNTTSTMNFLSIFGSFILSFFPSLCLLFLAISPTLSPPPEHQRHQVQNLGQSEFWKLRENPSSIRLGFGYFGIRIAPNWLWFKIDPWLKNAEGVGFVIALLFF